MASTIRQIVGVVGLLIALVGFPTVVTAQVVLPEPIYFGGVTTQDNGHPADEKKLTRPGLTYSGFDNSPINLAKASLTVGISQYPSIWATADVLTDRYSGELGTLYSAHTTAIGGVTYSFEIVGAKDVLVPVSITSSGSIFGDAGTIEDGRLYFSAAALFYLSDPAPYVNENGIGAGILGASACTTVDWCFWGDKYIADPDSSGSYHAGFHNLVQTTQLRSNKIYHITILSFIELQSIGGGGASYQAMIYPFIEIDPEFNISGLYSLAFSPGVGNSLPAIPEPESYAMLLAGLGLMGAVARRRKKKLIAGIQ